MPKKLLSQLLDENGNEILYSGALVVDATTGKTFSEHVADKNAHPDFGDLAIQNQGRHLRRCRSDRYSGRPPPRPPGQTPRRPRAPSSWNVP